MNPNSKQHIIKLSKSKIFLLTLGSIVFVFLGIWIGKSVGFKITFHTILAQVISLITIAFFGMTGIFGITKLFDFKPGLTINSIGILDNSSAVSGQLIKWKDIKGFDIIQVNSTKFLLIHVRNPKDYINRANSFKRFWMKMNEKKFKTPLSISSNSLECNFDELIKVIEIKLNENVNNN
ncbi:STM3941 family protein [Psychroserpens sp.]|uniref:STM3941 family protein n=1 Tax=Psychroserpens sp. TaxID=2020870 RepID=UPI00385B05FD